MTKSFFTTLALGGILTLTVTGGTAHAAVLITGDVNPADPSNWVNQVPLYIGQSADGSISVNAGSSLTVPNETVNLGSAAGVTGTITVDGVGSSWSGGLLFNVGNGGTGIVNVSNGGTLDSVLRVGWVIGSTGFLNITNGGSVHDALIAGQFGSTGFVTVDGVGSQLGYEHGGVSVGDIGTGTLTVTNGGTVISNGGGLARGNAAIGRAILDGVGSSWTAGIGGMVIGGGAFGGGGGKGLLTVTNGALMANAGEANLGFNTDAVGRVMVNGAGSTWTNSFGLKIGKDGIGQVSVTDGSTLTGTPITVNSRSLLTVDVGTGTSVTSSGPFVLPQLTNDGTIRTVAKATAANGTYTPITASGAWTGTGQVQALGGVWNGTTHTMTVSTAATGQAGVATTIDRSITQRMLITDSATGKSVGASFQATTSPANLSLTASLMNNSQLSLLQGLLDPGKAILSGWDFSATGYTAGDPVYLSLEIGAGQKFLDLDIWHFDGTSWGKYLNTDLAYDNTFASFVVTGFSGYAVSGVAPVPVPAAVWLFASGIVAVIGLARRKC